MYNDARLPHYEKIDVDWVLTVLKGRIADINDATLLEYIYETLQAIANYINRGYVPQDLKYTVVNMTMDLLKSNAIDGIIQGSSLGDIQMGALASIKDGDSELKFSTTKNHIGSHVADVDSILYNYKSQLDKFRSNSW